MAVTTPEKNIVKNKDLDRHNRLFSVKTVVGLALVLLLLGALGGMAVTKRQQTRTLTFVIPSDTGRQIAAGQIAVNFPDEIVLTVGIQDTIVIENQDDVIHSFGPFVVGPHSTLTKRFEVPITYDGACTFHPEQHMRLVVNPAPWDFFN